jgi:proline dehydrogenase
MKLDRAVLFRLATSERFEQAVKRAPGGEAIAWRAASRYLAGRSREDALLTVADLLARGLGVSIDLFGERVDGPAEADQVVAQYLELISVLPPPPAQVWVSVDLSHLALAAGPRAAAARLRRLAEAVSEGCRVQVGAEEAAVTDAVLGCVLEVAGADLASRLGATIQANLTRSPADADALADAGIHVRLVKGAYLERRGALAYGEATDVAFLRLGSQLARRGAAWSMATHDARLREALLLAHPGAHVEQLLGVRPEALDELRARDVPVRVYVPYGADWFRFWLRRAAESRGA